MEKTNLFHNGFSIPKNISFLIIDDEPDITEMIQEELELMGFEGPFTRAHNLDEAQKELRKTKLDYILCDWNLPDGEGIDLLEAARKSNKYGCAPFVMVTGNNNSDDMLKSKYEGISEYVVKPWEHEDFKSKIFFGWAKEKAKSSDIIKELNQKNIELEAKVDELESQVALLEAKLNQN
jgi:two-component system chemotaxis response regulator CheY